jgi:hypothetical protein
MHIIVDFPDMGERDIYIFSSESRAIERLP